MEIKGLRQDFEAELAAERPALFAYVRGIVRYAEIAEDITQEAMLRAYRSNSGLKDYNRLVPWLTRSPPTFVETIFGKS